MNSVFEVLGMVGIGLSAAAPRRALTAPDPRLDTAGTTPRIDLAAAERAVADLLTARRELDYALGTPQNATEGQEIPDPLPAA